MTDIVERLRLAGLTDGFAVIPHKYIVMAADEIERLRAALKAIAEQDYDAGYTPEEMASMVLSRA